VFGGEWLAAGWWHRAGSVAVAVSSKVLCARGPAASGDRAAGLPHTLVAKKRCRRVARVESSVCLPALVRCVWFAGREVSVLP
jgi:hypothetical protein